MHIDRSPDTFSLIIRHLRGYSVVAENECQNQDLLNDAQYFGLKKLTSILKQFVYLNIGGTSFRLRWELFNKGTYKYIHMDTYWLYKKMVHTIILLDLLDIYIHLIQH